MTLMRLGMVGMLLVLGTIAGCRNSRQCCCCECCGPEIVVPATETKPATKPEAEAQPLPQAPEVKPVVLTDVHGADPKGVGRRSFADITAHPCYGHAPDYSWLTGELQHVRVSNTWRVRYASVDETDRYGGSVTLVDCGPLDGFVSGQIVKVEGELIDPTTTETSPRYRVRTIQPWQNQSGPSF